MTSPKLLPKQCDNKRLLGSWPVPDEVTSTICRHAGREASAALYIALYKNRANGQGASAALEAIYYEPFTYWDWHSVHPDDDSAFKQKRQLLWERQRGFQKSVHDKKEGYPSPREAWKQFQARIHLNPKRIPWVKRIAVAHWMNVQDVKWIITTLKSIEALDLADAPYLTKTINEVVDITYPDVTNTSSNVSKTWPLYISESGNQPAALFLRNLKWLGLPDFQDPTSAAPLIMIERLLPRCESLQTICIRGIYYLERPDSFLYHTHYIDYFRNTFLDQAPASVSTLELRFKFVYLNEIIRCVDEKNETRNLKISRVGIDLGAWIQTLPFQGRSDSLQDDNVISMTRHAAQKAHFDTYELERNRTSPESSEWRLPEYRIHPAHTASTSAHPSDQNEARTLFKRNFYGEQRWEKLRQRHDDTVSGMLRLTHLFGIEAASCGITLYALKPEWQVKSTDPIHPLAMIERQSRTPFGEPVDRDFSELDDGLPVRLQEAYLWLNENFNWRPIFDWDYFLNPNSAAWNDATTTVCGNTSLIPRPTHPKEQVLDDIRANEDGLILEETAKHFQYLQKAGIPVHVLLGRRPPGQSSLYWGWPCDAAALENLFTASVDTRLEPVLPYINTLSILYDIRNPLDQHRLEDIDMRQLHEGPEASCPRPICPWKESKNCPFKLQWKDRPSYATKRHTQKTANKKQIGKTPYLPLANNSPSYPPTGEYASDDPNDDLPGHETLHQLAIRAAFDREALGWQKFWAGYASELKNLTALHVRMPGYFDKVRSWSLAKLLDRKHHWRMVTYADERDHIQSREDLQQHAGSDEDYTHSMQHKIWPAGRFVRRSWFKVPPEPLPEVVESTRGVDEANAPNEPPPENDVESNNANQKRTNRVRKPKEEEEKREREEFEKAAKIAREAARAERQLQAEVSARGVHARTSSRDPTVPPSSGVGNRLQDEYGRHIHSLARTTWMGQMRGFIDELRDMERREASGTSETGATQGLSAIRTTRKILEQSVNRFNPNIVFRESNPELRMRNGVGLVNIERDYTLEEQDRREKWAAIREAAKEKEATEAKRLAEEKAAEVKKTAEEKGVAEKKALLADTLAKTRAVREKASVEEKAHIIKEATERIKAEAEREKEAEEAKKIADAKKAEKRTAEKEAAEKKRAEVEKKAIEAKTLADAKEAERRATEKKATGNHQNTRTGNIPTIVDSIETHTPQPPALGRSPPISNSVEDSDSDVSEPSRKNPTTKRTTRARSQRAPSPPPEIVAVTRAGRKVVRPRNLTRTPTPLHDVFSDYETSSENKEEEDDGKGKKKGKKRKEPGNADAYQPPKKPEKGGRGKKRAAADSDDDEEYTKPVKKKKKKKKPVKNTAKKPVKKEVKKGTKAADENDYSA